jgi:hypothetical protein
MSAPTITTLITPAPTAVVYEGRTAQVLQAPDGYALLWHGHAITTRHEAVLTKAIEVAMWLDERPAPEHQEWVRAMAGEGR